MPWVRADDQFPVNRKVRPLSDRAFRLYVSALCWCNANLTDGVIKTRELMYVSDVSSPRQYADELVDAGLWSKTHVDMYADVVKEAKEFAAAQAGEAR